MIKKIKHALLLFAAGAFAFSLPPAILTLGSYIYFHSTEVILPGVTVASVEVGNLTVEQAEQAIDTEFNQEMDLLLIEVPSTARSWSVAPQDFGISVNARTTAATAFQVGRQGGFITQVETMLSVLREGRPIRPEIVFDEVQANRAIISWANELHEQPANAWLELLDGNVYVHPAEAGSSVDAARTYESLSGNFESILLEDGWLPLYSYATEPQRSDIRQQAAQLEQLLQDVPSIRAYDPVTDEHFTWEPDRQKASGWLSLNDDGERISIAVDAEGVRTYVDELVAFLGPERYLDRPAVIEGVLTGWQAGQDGQHIVHYYPSEYVVRPGDTLISIAFKVHMPYWKLHEVNPTLVTHGLSSGLELKVPPKDDLLTLPVIPEKRIVISISEQRMWVKENGQLKWEHVVSTGIPDSPTMPGIFQISSHYENAYASIWDLYMPHFMGIYDAVPGLTNGIHGLPVLSNGRRLWANVLGSPASYGCIILDLQAAEELYHWAEAGVVVEIKE